MFLFGLVLMLHLIILSLFSNYLKNLVDLLLPRYYFWWILNCYIFSYFICSN